MDGSSSSRGRRPHPGPLRAGMLAAAAGVAVLATACGAGGSTSSTPGLPTLADMTNKALVYAKCMRAHGITNFPDPTVQDTARSKGVGFSLNGIDTHSAQFQSAGKACERQTGFGHISAAQRQAALNALLKVTECMRSHGIANYPDPFANSNQIGFNMVGTGIDQNSPQFKAAQKACRPLLPDGGP